MMKVHIILMVWQLLVLTLEGLQRIPRTASGKPRAEKVDWDLCDAEVYNNLGGLGGRNEPGTDLSSGKKEIRFKKIGKTSKGEAIDLVITNTTEYVPNPRTPKAARKIGERDMGAQYFNGRKDCVGVFNIDSPSEVTLKFSMVLAGTDKLVPEGGIYDFTIFDFDKSRFGVVEQITVQGIDDWVGVEGKTTPIIDGDKYIFSALPEGVEVDNPSDPYNLTEAQIDASIGFEYSVNEWEIVFKAIDTQSLPPGPGHPGGRNFHFAGRSKLQERKIPTPSPTPHPPCDPNASTTVDWDVCNAQVYSNLGGLGGANVTGKRGALRKEIRYDSIVKLSSGETLDLVITNTTEYVPNPDNPKAAREAGNTVIGGQYFNGRRDCLGVFNIIAPGEVTLKFSMVLTGTDTLAPTGTAYDLTIYDFDASKKGIVEQIVVKGIDAWVQRKSTPIVNGDTYIFGAHPGSPEVDNPSDPYNLTEAQIDASVGFVYSVNEWVITFKAIDTEGLGDRQGRNFMFSGRSTVQQECNPDRSPPPH